jgi:hypothetical protein
VKEKRREAAGHRRKCSYGKKYFCHQERVLLCCQNDLAAREIRVFASSDGAVSQPAMPEEREPPKEGGIGPLSSNNTGITRKIASKLRPIFGQKTTFDIEELMMRNNSPIG